METKDWTTLTNDERFKQVDALRDEISESNKLISTLTEENKITESIITSIVDAFPRESNPSTDKMLSLIDKRDGWTYKGPVTHYDTQRSAFCCGNICKPYIVYDFMYCRDESRPWLRLYCDLISDSDDKQTMKCSIKCWKMVFQSINNELRRVRLKRRLIKDQKFLDLKWNIIYSDPPDEEMATMIEKELDIRGLTDETINTELDKIEEIF